MRVETAAAEKKKCNRPQDGSLVVQKTKQRKVAVPNPSPGNIPGITIVAVPVMENAAATVAARAFNRAQ